MNRKTVFPLLVILLGLIFNTSTAQIKDNYLSVGLEAGPVLKRYNSSFPYHFGLPIKAYFGRNMKGSILLRTGVHYFHRQGSDFFLDVKSSSSTIVPLAIGYRKNLKDWYLEGSLGIASRSYTYRYHDTSLGKEVNRYWEINYGLEIGRQWENINVSLAVYNTGPIPYNLLYAGLQTSYRFKW